MPSSPAGLSQPEREKIRDFLDSHPVGVLATVDSEGNPNASTVYISVDSDLNVSFTTKENTRKHQNISNHPTVALLIFDAGNQSVVQLNGQAEEITNPEAASRIYHGTLQAAEQTGEDVVPPVAKIAAGPYVAYTIKPQFISMKEYGWGNNFDHALKHANDQPDTTSDPA